MERSRSDVVQFWKSSSLLETFFPQSGPCDGQFLSGTFDVQQEPPSSLESRFYVSRSQPKLKIYYITTKTNDLYSLAINIVHSPVSFSKTFEEINTSAGMLSDHIHPTGVDIDCSRILPAKEPHDSRLLRAKENHLARQESPLDDSASESSVLRKTEESSMITDDSMISEQSSVPEGYAQVKVFMDPMGKGAMENPASKERWSWSTSTTGATGKTIQTMESGASSASMVRNIFAINTSDHTTIVCESSQRDGGLSALGFLHKRLLQS